MQDAPDALNSDGGDAGDGGGTQATDSEPQPAPPSQFEASGVGGNSGGGSTGGKDDLSDGLPTRVTKVQSGIDLRLADKHHVQADYVGAGASPLRVARVYHSNLAAHPAQVTVPMGTGWRSYYDRSVQVISGAQVRLHRANGRVLDYTYSGGAWASAMPGGVLTQVSGGWQYVNHRNMVENYGSNGKLASLAKSGRVTSMQYDGTSRLSQVVLPFGRRLVYGYDGAGRVGSVTLPDGNALTYGYDANNNLTSTRFADASVRQYVYENTSYRNALTGVVDATGKRTPTWGYDGAGRPNHGHYGAASNPVNIVYGSNQAVVTDARGTQRTRTFTTAGPRTVLVGVQTAATTDSAATGWSFNYDANGNVQRVVSRSGEVRQISVDNRARVVSATRAYGTAQAMPASITWHPVFRKPVQIVSRGLTLNRTIDAFGRTTQVTQTGTNGVTTTALQKTYNAQNLLQSVTNARGATRSFTYDTLGNRTSITNALGQVTSLSNFNAHGQAGRVDRVNGMVITRAFDVRGRLTSRTVGGRTTGYTYDAAGRFTQATLADGSWRHRNFDAAGYLSSITNDRSETTSYVRDVDGKVTNRSVLSSTGTVAGAQARQYDAVSRVAAVVDTRGKRTQMLYAADGRPSGVTDPLGLSFTQQLDLLNRATTLTQPNTTAMRLATGQATVNAYLNYHPTYGTHQSTTDTVAIATGFSSDALNRRVAEAGTDAGAKAWVRNAAGDVTSVTDARNVTLTMARDSAGRLTSVTPPTGTALTYGYVPGRTDSLPAQMTDPSGSSAWTYDAQGRLLTKRQTVDAIARTLTVTRDTLGRVSSMTYPSGMRVDTTYSGSVLTSLSVNGVALINNISYRPFTQTANAWRWGNGTTHSRTIDADGRVGTVSLGSIQRSYVYDAAGRVSGYSDIGGQGTVLSNFGYDEAGQLITYTGPAGSFSYTYDTNGNRRSVVKNGTAANLSYAAGTNRLLTSPRGSYYYGADGNPSTDGYLSYLYDNYGRLTTLQSDFDKNVRGYNGQGLRVKAVGSVWVGDPQLQAPTTGSAMAMTAKKKPAPVLLTTPQRLTTTRSANEFASDPVAAGKSTPGDNIVVGGDPGPGHWVVNDTRHYFHTDDGQLLGEYNVTTGYKQETIWFNGAPVATMINGVLYNVRADNLGTPRSIARASDNLEVWRWDSDPPSSTPIAVSG